MGSGLDLYAEGNREVSLEDSRILTFVDLCVVSWPVIEGDVMGL